ncbi:putative inactive serine/threonine-protein kinase scy1 [Dorcoceras hygrometricum]|nr:putative inactive serine/threonine-protein kinase scy1 [Dorcoceras hygrometricum]
MAASFFVNAMQVEFEYVLAMEHTGMAKMFKSLEDTRLKGFLEASGSVYEAAVVNSSLMQKLLLERSVPNKKKEMKIEYRLLHEIVAKALSAKAGSFDVVTNFGGDGERSYQAVTRFAVQVSVQLQNLVKSDLRELVKFPPQKVLNNKSIHTYIKKNLNVVPAGESSKKTDDTVADDQDCGKISGNNAEDEVVSNTVEAPEAHVGTTPENEGRVNNAASIATEKSVVTKQIWSLFKMRFKDVSSFENLAKIKENFLFLDETEMVSDLFERRSLVLYKLYEMEVQKRVDEHRANFKPAEPSVNYDYMSSIVGDAANVDLPQITWSEARKFLLMRANPAQLAQPNVLALDFSTQEEQEETAAKQSAQQEEGVEEIVRTTENVEGTVAVNSPEHQANGNKQQARTEEHQAPGDEQQVHGETTPESEHKDERLTPAGSSNSSSSHDREDSTQDGPQPISLPNLQIMDNTAKELTSLKDSVSSLDLKVERIKADTYFARHSTVQLRRQLETSVDGLEIKIDMLESTLVRHFADSQQHLVDELAFVKSHAECLIV